MRPATARTATLAAGLLLAAAGPARAGDALTVPGAGLSGDPAGDRVCPLVFTDGGAYTVIVSARSTVPGLPRLEVQLDGTNFLAIDVESHEWTPFSETIEIGPGRRDLRLHADAAGASLEINQVTILSEEGQAPPTFLNAEQYEQDLDARRQDALDRAEENIARLRAGKIEIALLADAGGPASGVQVRVRQVRHAFAFGVRLDPGVFDAAYAEDTTRRHLDEILRLFSAAAPGDAVSWASLEPRPREWSFDVLDRMLNWCRINGLQAWGPVLFSPCRRFAPAWAGETAGAAFDNAAREHVARTVTRCRDSVTAFEIHADGAACGPDGPIAGPALANELFLAAAAAGPSARFYTLEQGVLETAGLASALQRVGDLKALGIPVGGVGIALDAAKPVDVLALREALDRLGSMGLPVAVTALDLGGGDTDEAARTLEHVLRLAFGHEAVAAVFLSEVDPLRPNRALRTYETLVADTWRTEVAGATDASGRFACDAFLGRYEVVLGDGPQAASLALELTDTEREATITRRWP